MSTKKFRKIGILMITVAMLSLTLTSCHRYGCPNQITDNDQTEQIENC